ncbi:MAG: CHASE2 domain-containing protein [Cyanobacteriota bacterium]|nr:CHASE2 domain-containing protein [Cyanobacteriota bacterium]
MPDRRWNIFSRNFRQNIALWGLLPGTFAIALIVVARMTGMLESFELRTFDLLLRLRPVEIIDDRILLVGIDAEDIDRIGTYPIPDKNLAQLIEHLQTYQPAVIGLNITRELPVEPGHAELMKAFAKYENLIAIEKVLPPKILPPEELPSTQLSFNDFPLDPDFHGRRQYLGIPTPKEYKFSLSLRLAEVYLARKGLMLDNGVRDPSAMQFGEVELPRLYPHSGAYMGVDDGGVQVLLNFRSSPQPFRTVSMQEIETGEVKPEWIRDRIVIIGITDPNFQSFVTTSAIANTSGKIGGTEFQAHAVSQILSAVLDGRSMLQVWWEGWEYLWIVGWGLGGMAIGYRTRLLRQNVLGMAIASISLLGVSYVVIYYSWWIPLVPPLLAFLFGNLICTTFVAYDKVLRLIIREQQEKQTIEQTFKKTIEQTFNIIHNGPLQTLATILMRTDDGNLSSTQFFSELEKLNREIRAVGDRLEKQVPTQKSFHLGSQLTLNLDRPIDELFYEIYSNTLDRDLAYFESIKITEVKFDTIDDDYLSLEQKQELCYFLQEALCNVGKHAKRTTQLIVTGKQNDGYYTLRIADNGEGKASNYHGRGKKQSSKLVHMLHHGKINSGRLNPKGYKCCLKWYFKK